MSPTRLLLVSWLAMAAAGQVNPAKEGEKQVRQLDKNSFPLTAGRREGGEDWLVLLQSPGCGHCQRFKPTFAKLAFDLREGPVRFGEVNCREDPDVCKLLRVKAYPTLLFFRGGEMFRFEGRRGEDELTEFVRGGYAKARGLPVPDRMPGLLEEISTAFFEMTEELSYVLSSGHWLLKLFVLAFLAIVGALMLASLYFVVDIFRPRSEPVKTLRVDRDQAPAQAQAQTPAEREKKPKRD